MTPPPKMSDDYRPILIISGAVAAGLLFVIFVYKPLAAKIRVVKRDIQHLNQELETARLAVGAGGVWDPHERDKAEQHLLTSQEIPLAMDAITTAGTALGINFINIRPQEQNAAENVSHPYLLIHMDIESDYQSLGRFLGRLANLEKGIMVVHSFEIQRVEAIIPQVKAALEVAVYLQGEPDGQE